MLKFGFRKLHFYPLMLLLFTFLRRSIEIVLKHYIYDDNIEFIIPFLIFFSQSLFGGIIYLYYIKKNISEEGNKHNILSPFKVGEIRNVTNKSNSNKYSKIKKIILIFFTSFFNSIGSIIRNDDFIIFFKIVEDKNTQLEIKIRSIQIIISSLLYIYAIRFNIYQHQKLSLIIISFFFVCLILMELFFSVNLISKIVALLFCFMSCLSRSFLDVTEKYLFDFDFINIFKMLLFEGLMGLFLFIINFLMNEAYQSQGKVLLKDMARVDITLIIFILLIILYIIFSGFKNAYRVSTNKYYSPMSRALFESTLDPFLFIYNSLSFDNKDKTNYWIYFLIVLFSLVIISFFSLVYNDFIILYCCGLQHITYDEITNRLYSQPILEDDDLLNENENETSSSVNEEGKAGINIELNSDYIIEIK